MLCANVRCISMCEALPPTLRRCLRYIDYVGCKIYLYYCIIVLLYYCEPLQKCIHNLVCAGTLPAKMVPKNIEIQGGTLPFFLFESQEYYCITAIKSSKFQSIFGIFGRHFVGFLVIVAVRAPLWIPRGPKRAPKAAQRRFGDQFVGIWVSFWGPGGSLSGS